MSSAAETLPTLEEVLSRKTAPPLCLYNFYIIMRDRLQMEEVLDFYLDVQHHEQLWRRYIRSLRKSGFLTEQDLADGYQSPRLLSRLSNTYSYDDEKLTLDTQRTSSMPPPSRQDLAESAQRILLRYLVPSASKELTQLPQELKNAIRRELDRSDPRDDPLVFSDAKEYLFEYMQRYAYPKFLRLKVWGNVTLWQQMGRLVLGLVALLTGFATALSLIFLGYPQWGVRFWVLLPMWFSILNLLVFLTGLDPFWVLLFNIRYGNTISAGGDICFPHYPISLFYFFLAKPRHFISIRSSNHKLNEFSGLEPFGF
ncbi:uncharacterized protein BYT42DRAFT_504322 [Radiomyces spectabilis]|uniref:uncharacterized protein n=1 Tax=Radiomyces spectabilis TaxID=64574 RepID=UPI00222127A0|nr:uncharacterized protein BYT42DRAFT_504322 [Radiomyces spectabilis]KAI8367473.1 hypothetical protein BYT42DRAFT_504322 [Radiomyces spectabilis]